MPWYAATVAFACTPPVMSAADVQTTPSSVCRRPFLAKAAALMAMGLLRLPAAEAAESQAESPGQDSPEDSFVRLASGLEYRDYRVGTGAVAAEGDVVTVKWTGRLADR